MPTATSSFSDKIAEVPRYPPFKRGIPFLDSGLCLAQHNDLLEKLRITLRFTNEEFDQFAVPPLKRFADYVHLLPASKNHHHRAAGGLLRHSLEVALYAGMSAGGRVFGAEETMRVRTKMRRQYIYAAFILGLGHDVGKAFSDMVITSKADNSTWNPYSQSLADWCRQHVPENHRYLVKFHQKRRHKHHEVFSTFALNFILGPESIEFLTDDGNIMEPLESVIAVTSDTGRIKQFSNADELSKILKLAEKKSCDRDLKGKMDVLGMDTTETPFPEHIVAKINHLLHEEFMSANSPKSRLFIVDSQAFVAWDQAFADLLFYEFQKDAISIPKEADTLLGAMVDFGLVHLESNPAKRPQIKVRHKSGISHVFNVIELDAGAFSELFEEVIDTGCSVEVVYAKQASDKPAANPLTAATPTQDNTTKAPSDKPKQKSEMPDPKDQPSKDELGTENASKNASEDRPKATPAIDPQAASATDDDSQGLDETFNPQKFLEELIAAHSGESEQAPSAAQPKGKKQVSPSKPQGKTSSSKGREGSGANKKRPSQKSKGSMVAAKPTATQSQEKTEKPQKKKPAATQSQEKTAITPAPSADKPSAVARKPKELPNSETENSGDVAASTAFFEMVKNGQVGEQFEVERAADAYHVIAVPNKLYAHLGKELGLPPYRVRSLLTHVYENEPDGIDSIRIIVPIGGPQKP